jgi:serine/threonine-protein kinase
MLTGDPPHTGSSAQAILGKILLGEVTRPTKLRRTIPANVEGVLLKALERLPADRFETAAELAAALKDKTFRHGVGAAAVGGPWKAVAIGATMVAVLAVVMAVTGVLAPEPPRPQALWQEITPPGDGAIEEWASYFALAPDGSSIVYRDTVGLKSGWQLWVKERGSMDSRPLSGTTNARDVVYSPDGQWIVYTVDTELIKRPIQGAGTQTLLEGMDNAKVGPSWMPDGTILCEQEGNTLVRISADGGRPPDTVFVFSPDLLLRVRGLPGEAAALAAACIDGACTNGSVLYVVDLQADTAWVIQDEVLDAWYVETGHVVWVRRDGAVFATPFDPVRLETTGAPIPLFEGVRTYGSLAEIVMGKEGTVVFVEGAGDASRPRMVVWVDRDGSFEPVDPNWGTGPFGPLALSPMGDRLAVDHTDESGRQIWVKELPDGPATRVTSDPGASYWPAWSPDGATIAYHTSEGGTEHIRAVPSDGRSAGASQVLLQAEQNITEVTYTADGEGLLYTIGSGSLADLGYLDLAAGERSDSLLATEFGEWAAVLSRDGRWIAYTSNAAGGNEVLVRPFPEVNSGVRQVSRDGGSEPVWARNGNELFYRDRDGWMISARFSADSVFSVEGWERLFDARPFFASYRHRGYDYSPWEDRFLMVLRDGAGTGSGEEPHRRTIQIQNFFTELEERVGGGG